MKTIMKFAATLGMSAMLLVPALALAQNTVVPVTGPANFGLTVNSVTLGATAGLGERDVRVTIAAIIRGLMGFLGIVAVVIVLIGGFQWMTAGGAEEKVKSAQKLLIAGLIGLIIIILAFAITSYVFTQLLTPAIL